MRHRSTRQTAITSVLFLTCMLTGVSLSPIAWAGHVGGARSSAHGSSRSSSGSGRGGSSSSLRTGGGYRSGNGYSYSYAYGFDPWSWFFLRALVSPFWAPHAITDDDYSRTYAFPSAPYENGIDGYVRIDGVTGPSLPAAGEAPAGQSVLGHSAALRLSAEGALISSTINRFGFSALLSTNSRVEIGTDWSLLREQLPVGDPSGKAVDSLWIGSIDASMVFAQGPNSQFRTGLGLRAMVDPTGNEYGINFLYAMDFYPVQPVVLSFRGDLGTVGQAFVARARGTLGLVLGRFELYGGYDKLWIGEEAFGGPTVGVRMWN